MVKKIAKTIKKATTKKPIAKPAKSVAQKTSKTSMTKKSVKKSVTKAVKKAVIRQITTVKPEPTEKTSPKNTMLLKNRSEKEKELFEKLKDLLLKRKMEIINVFDNASSEMDDENITRQNGVGDVVDTASDAVEIEINLKLAEYGSRELGQIDNALTKMSEGSYGICESCEGNITVARIKALPFATKCIKCQQEEDENSQEYYNSYSDSD